MTTSSHYRHNRALSGFHQHEDQGRGRRSSTGATFKVDGVTQSRKRQRRPPLVGDRGPGVRRPPADVHRHAFARSALPRGRTVEIAVDFLIDRNKPLRGAIRRGAIRRGAIRRGAMEMQLMDQKIRERRKRARRPSKSSE